jgi:hypothetical protein
MRSLLAAGALVGALAAGGVPMGAIGLSAGEGTAASAVAEQGAHPGPPAWSQGRGRAKQGDKHADQFKGWAEGWSGAKAEIEGDADGRRGEQAKPGQAARDAKVGTRGEHGRAMRAWSKCVVGDGAGLPGDERPDREAACGAKPTPPGHLR